MILDFNSYMVWPMRFESGELNLGFYYMPSGGPRSEDLLSGLCSWSAATACLSSRLFCGLSGWQPRLPVPSFATSWVIGLKTAGWVGVPLGPSLAKQARQVGLVQSCPLSGNHEVAAPRSALRSWVLLDRAIRQLHALSIAAKLGALNGHTEVGAENRRRGSVAGDARESSPSASQQQPRRTATQGSSEHLART